MRLFIFALVLAAGLNAWPTEDSLPKATLTANSMGGDVLMLDGNRTLSIDGETNTKLIKELGEKGKKDFFRDMILSVPVEKLKKTYGAKDHPTTLSVIGKYQILNIPAAKPSTK